jgi:ABC-2 type transport system permease protein
MNSLEKKTVKFVMEVDPTINDVYQVFYSFSGDKFSEDRSVIQSVTQENKGNLEFSIPALTEKLRIDFGSTIRDVKIKKMDMVYKKAEHNFSISDSTKILTSYNNIDKCYYDQKDQYLHIVANSNDPFAYLLNVPQVIKNIITDPINKIYDQIWNVIYSILIAIFIFLSIRILSIRKRIVAYVLTFLKYTDLTKELIKRDIKVKYRRSVLGLLWTLINPLLTMFIITLVFSTIFRFDIKNFPAYFLTGQIIFGFFSEATSMSMQAVLQNSLLIKKVYIPKYIFPLSRTLSSFVNLLFSLAAVVIVLAVTHVKVTWTILLLPLPLIYILFFSLGVGMFLSTYVVFFRDLTYIYGIFLTIISYLTPIFYPISIIPNKFQFMVFCNPLYYFVEEFRCIALYGDLPNFKLNMICIAMCVISMLLGMYTFHKNQDKFILYI